MCPDIGGLPDKRRGEVRNHNARAGTRTGLLKLEDARLRLGVKPRLGHIPGHAANTMFLMVFGHPTVEQVIIEIIVHILRGRADAPLIR